MAENAGPGGFADPVNHAYSDWFELYNPNAVPVNLAGYYLTDSASAPDKWKIPPGTVIGPNQFLLVWADAAPELNASDPAALHVNFQLNKTGDFIGLYGPDGTPRHTVAFGPQSQNISQGLFPDGNTNSVQPMTLWTPAAPNSLQTPASPGIGPVTVRADGSIAFPIDTLPRRTYRVEFKDDLRASAWSPLGGEVVGNGGAVNITDPSTLQFQRFYRVLLVP